MPEHRQNGRLFEIQLEPLQPNLSMRKIWNLHLRWYEDASHHEDIKKIITKGIQENVTIAGDTNGPIAQLCKNIHEINFKQSVFSQKMLKIQVTRFSVTPMTLLMRSFLLMKFPLNKLYIKQFRHKA